jgi:hypothetical protein
MPIESSMNVAQMVEVAVTDRALTKAEAEYLLANGWDPIPETVEPEDARWADPQDRSYRYALSAAVLVQRYRDSLDENAKTNLRSL